jgi:RNA polymerase sigma-70 factor (ECF subfamily)
MATSNLRSLSIRRPRAVANSPARLQLLSDPRSPDEQLIARVLRGGADAKAAIASLYGKYRRAVRAVAASFQGLDGDELEDITQDTFVRAFRSLASLKSTDRFSGWLFTIARNRALRHLSARATRQRLGEDCSRESLLTVHAPPSAPEQLEREADLRVVRRAISALREGAEKETLTLFYVEGELTAREIGARLGVGKSAVTMRLDRFRKRLGGQIARRCLRA